MSTSTQVIDSAMFRELADRVEQLVSAIHWQAIEGNKSFGMVRYLDTHLHCSLQTFDQPDHEGLLFSTHIMALPIPPESDTMINTFNDHASKFLYPQIAAMIVREEKWFAIGFKNIVFPGQTGYTDAKLIALCELNLM
jgi:hypothetical protein